MDTNKKIFKRIFFAFILIAVVFMPFSIAEAQNNVKCFIPNVKCLIPCDGSTANPCTFESFIQLIQNLINFLIFISIPIAAIAFAWAGFLMVTSSGSEEKVTQAKGIFTKVGVGFLFVLSAWLIVYTITTALLLNSQGYTLLK